jgi:hypothetical protein
LCDLHVEFGNFAPPVVGADVVVLAGDVHVKNRGLQWIFDQEFEIPVLYVLGNHEFYREKFPGLIDKLKMDAEGTNVRILENDSVEIGKYRFFGCTLWSDMELLDDEHASSIGAADTMNDYSDSEIGGESGNCAGSRNVCAFDDDRSRGPGGTGKICGRNQLDRQGLP